MAKRFTGIFLISLGVALACVCVFVMVLLMAPGLSVFGLKYIAKGTHVVDETYVLAEQLEGGNFSGTIRIEVDEVPIYVEFSQRYTYQVEYYDNYNGFTTSNFDDPSIKFSKEPDGTAVISVTSFKKFVYENSNSSRHIKLIVPESVVGGTDSGRTNLKIVSKTSPVHFCNEIDDYRDPVFNCIDIETYGAVTSSAKVAATTYKLKTINAITIDSDEVKNINATNYDLTSTGGKIVVSREVVGDITATTKNARIQILSCNNFTANSGFGDVYSASADKGITINGSANITTTAGIVNIDSILGDQKKSVINTKTGNVTIKKAKDLEVNTTRGFVKINATESSVITTSSGSILVESANESVTAKTKRGKITLGGESNVLHNPTVETTFGDVSVVSASGTVKIDTVQSDVNFVNLDASNIKMSVGGNLTATKLTGSVNIEVEGNADIDFSDFNQKSSIVGKNESSMITVKLINNLGSTFSYNLQANDASLFEYNVEDPQNHFQIARSTNLTSSADMVGKPLLSVVNKGRVVVYYQRSV